VRNQLYHPITGILHHISQAIDYWEMAKKCNIFNGFEVSGHFCERVK